LPATGNSNPQIVNQYVSSEEEGDANERNLYGTSVTVWAIFFVIFLALLIVLVY